MPVLDNLTAAVNARVATFTQQLSARAQPLLERYRELQPREQLIVGVGLVFVSLTLIYTLLWAPFALARSHQQTALAAERDIAQRLEVIGSAVQRARSQGFAGVQGQGQSLLTLVDKASREPQLGKTPSRIQPEGEKEVRVWFEDVSFDAMARWSASLESRYGLTVSNAEFEKRPVPGVVNARLTIVR